MALYAQIERTSGGTSGTITAGQMSIVIYDSATGLRTNGNNCVVTYQMNINGSVTGVLSATIPGISIPIYTGELSDTNPSSPFFTSFTVLSLTPGGGIINPLADDLHLVAIVSTPESAIGAGDGTVKIVATSSFPAITYSLDNITYQSNPIFTGQPGGIGTGYAKDTNGGLVSGPYSVGFVGNILVSDPSINLGGGNVSRWNSAFNPVFWKFQRKDFEITSVVLGAFTTILINVNADLTGVTARTTNGGIISPGDLVYIKTALYEGTFEVLERTASTLGLNCTHTADDTIGFANINSLKPYYQILMKVTYVDPISAKIETINIKSAPKSDGSLMIDLSEFLKTLLQAKDKSNYTLINYRDMQLSASYQVQYAETWTSASTIWITAPLPYYVVYSAKQLGDNGGGNLVDYVPYALGFQPAKWLSDFNYPVYSPGFPFDLPFIFSEYMVGLGAFYQITLLDINKNKLNTKPVINAFLLNEDGTFQLNQDGSKFIIASQSLTNVDIVEHVGLNRLLINFIPPDICWFFKVQLKYTAAGTTYNLTQPIICRVADRSDTDDRPVYLRWIGLNGSWNYFKFVYNQIVSLEVGNTVSVKRFVTDWQNEDALEDVISKNAGEKLQVFGENISVDDIKGLQAIKYSPKVQLMTQATPPKWQTVVVAPGTYTERETYIDDYSVNLTFALPSRNLQTQ